MSDDRPDCRSCGLCCRRPTAPPDLYPEDLERWAAEGLPWIAGPLRDSGGGDCPFLMTASGFRCAIYPARPLACRHFAAGGSACLELRGRPRM